ncbi:MAG: glycosyltransferase family 2 protein [Dehalococcoidia bacterium]|nr:glycosyltransferase family 2 protein [Dehalococcoidia bacterium]
MNPLVSVIIPVHNGAHFLPDSLASVFDQEYRPIEVIVADDGSTDGSAEVAESFPGVRCLRLEKGGVSRARNLAVAASTGEWLAFLDADDRWFPRKLTEQVALGEARPDAGLVLCREVHRFSVDIPEWFHGPTDGGAPRTSLPPGLCAGRSSNGSAGSTKRVPSARTPNGCHAPGTLGSAIWWPRK